MGDSPKAQVEVAAACGNHLGESPLWCPQSQTLFWIDCDPDPALFRLDPQSGAVQSWRMPARIQSLIRRLSRILLR